MSALHPLASSVPHPAPLRSRASTWLVLAALFAAPLAWSLQLLVSYLLVGDRCAAGAPASYTPTPLLSTVLGVAAVIVCAIGLGCAWRVWRVTREEAPGRHHEGLTAGHGRTRFLGLCGIVGSLIFLAASIFEFLVPLAVSPCALLSF